MRKWSHHSAVAAGNWSNCGRWKCSSLLKLLSATGNWDFVSVWATRFESIFENHFKLLGFHVSSFSTPAVQNVNFLFVPPDVKAEIIQILSVSISENGMFINICIGNRTDLSCSVTTKQSQFLGELFTSVISGFIR